MSFCKRKKNHVYNIPEKSRPIHMVSPVRFRTLSILRTALHGTPEQIKHSLMIHTVLYTAKRILKRMFLSRKQLQPERIKLVWQPFFFF